MSTSKDNWKQSGIKPHQACIKYYDLAKRLVLTDLHHSAMAEAQRR